MAIVLVSAHTHLTNWCEWLLAAYINEKKPFCRMAIVFMPAHTHLTNWCEWEFFENWISAYATCNSKTLCLMAFELSLNSLLHQHTATRACTHTLSSSLRTLTLRTHVSANWFLCVFFCSNGFCVYFWTLVYSFTLFFFLLQKSELKFFLCVFFYEIFVAAHTHLTNWCDWQVSISRTDVCVSFVAREIT